MPFHVIEDRMIVELPTKNGVLNLIFDTGSNISLIDSITARKKDLKFGSRFYISTTFKSFPCFDTDFDIGEPFPKMKWKIIDFKNEKLIINCHIDGLIGAQELIRLGETEIDFKNQVVIIGKEFDDTYSKKKSFDISNANKSKNGLGIYFSELASIEDSILLSSSHCRKLNLIIDTGCKYGLAFIVQDSLIMNDFKIKNANYNLFGIDSEIAFSRVKSKSFNSKSFIAPIFVDPKKTEIINNNFYGLLGIPFLKKFDKIIFDWSNRKISFINN